MHSREPEPVDSVESIATNHKLPEPVLPLQAILQELFLDSVTAAAKAMHLKPRPTSRDRLETAIEAERPGKQGPTKLASARCQEHEDHRLAAVDASFHLALEAIPRKESRPGHLAAAV